MSHSSSRAKSRDPETQPRAVKGQNYFVYNLTNADRHTVLCVDVTNDLERRASDHLLGRGSAFEEQYNANKLVYLEAFPDPQSAIAREKQLKNWSRAKKDVLIVKKGTQVARFVRRHVFT